MNTPSARDVEEPSDGLDAEDIKFLRSLRTSDGSSTSLADGVFIAKV